MKKNKKLWFSQRQRNLHFLIVILFRFLAQPMDNLYRKHKLGIELAMSQGSLSQGNPESKNSKKGI